MSTSILATKLYIPLPRPGTVLRPNLIERLHEGLHRKLTLISAPAGFGKTTLISAWVAGCEKAVAWLSLDKVDSDPIRFLVYLITALQTVAANLGEGALALLQLPQPAATEAILTALVNELIAIPDHIMLVIDDYHAVDSTDVDHILTFLLEHLPPQLHLVIVTRENPHIPLARFRAQGQMTELRAADLRFNAAEATTFLNQVMNLNLSPENIAALEKRTEGWIAGLQLAALALQGEVPQNTDSFITSFTGSHQYVLDYLVEEVLQQQPQYMQTFLLCTSILDRLCGSLCDALLPNQMPAGQDMLDAIEQTNLFIVPLDSERHWYRYHHLFADLLRRRLHRNSNKSTYAVAELHDRASVWYEQQGFAAEAFHHAIVAENFERAASLAELSWKALDHSFRFATWLEWVKKLPHDLIRTRPVLCAQYAETLLDSGEIVASEKWLQAAEQWLEYTDRSADEMVVVDEALFRMLPIQIALARAYHAQVHGDITGTIEYTEQALTHILPEDHISRASAAGILALTYWACGDLEVAHHTFHDFVVSSQQAGNILFAIASSGYLADISVAQGRLRAATKTYQEALAQAAEHHPAAQHVMAHLHLGLAMIYFEQGDQAAATPHLLMAEELGEQTSLIDWPYRWAVAQASLKTVRGNFAAALDWLDEAERRYVPNPIPPLYPLAARKARIYVRQGKLAEALDWVSNRAVSVDDELSYLHEFEHITLARVLIAVYQKDKAADALDDAMHLLARLLVAVEEGTRTASVLEIRVLHALAYSVQGNLAAAHAVLAPALILAEPEGYIRLFADEGPLMADLLYEAEQYGISPAYANRLRAAFEAVESPQLLIDPLSDRELDVLRLLNTDLNGPAIARKLMVSLNTMRTHTKNIYSKLGVNNRQDAIRRAAELNLL